MTKPAARGESEAEIKHAIRKALGRMPDVLLYNNPTGVTKLANGRTLAFGLAPGSSDLIGLGPGGRFLALEVKTKTGRATKPQTYFADLVAKYGGVAAIVRSPDEAEAVIEAMRAGAALHAPPATLPTLRDWVGPRELPRPKRARGRVTT